MKECIICYKSFNSNFFKILKCNHELCKNCYLKLEQPHCPYCRHPFTYLKEERNSFADYFEDHHYIDIVLLSEYINSIPIRKRHRRRRRDLSYEEILAARQIIRKKCRRKWKTKEGRLNKMRWFENNN